MKFITIVIILLSDVIDNIYTLLSHGPVCQSRI